MTSIFKFIKDILFNLLYLVPKNALSRFVGSIVRTPLPQPLGQMSVEFFASYYKINLNEAERDYKEYRTINALFTRKLKMNLRPLHNSPVVHPADSRISQFGQTTDGFGIQAKGKNYSVHEMTGDSQALQKWNNGTFITYYLCPTDYHRVHSPVAGLIKKITYIPGALWPVNDWSIENIDKLFCVNERICIEIETQDGPVMLVMVGATNVGKMTLSFDMDWVTNSPAHLQSYLSFANSSTSTIQNQNGNFVKTYAAPISIGKGDEVGIFHMGSTVVMLYPQKMNSQLKDLKLGQVQVRSWY